MRIKRRDFVKGCAGAYVLSSSGVVGAVTGVNAINTQSASLQADIKKSIKASFGDGFSVRAHFQSGGLTYANIEHFSNEYVVTSADLLDWKFSKPYSESAAFISI